MSADRCLCVLLKRRPWKENSLGGPFVTSRTTSLSVAKFCCDSWLTKDEFKVSYEVAYDLS